MRLEEVLDFWREALVGREGREGDDDFIVIDAQSIPGWVIALRRGPKPYIEIWWERDFLEEVQIRSSSTQTEPILEESVN